ncbi:Protein IN2- B [Ananas comosus]|uniref:Protein IN2-B n=1 Tax=Ananas comosus TaxID=4615 RepID=A0A199URV2_ANACO|nr:Protein IN2- B [Ananas comosus]
MAAAVSYAKEVLPPPLTSESEPPHLFDGTTRLYISYTCPYAQRTWIARNYKGLQEKIKLVPIDLLNRPAWYKEKVYSTNKDPEKRQFAEELLSYTDTFNKVLFTAIRSEGEVDDKVAPEWDKIEDALSKFDDGPFFLGQFSLVDIAYAPFIERCQLFLAEAKNYDITKGRPKLKLWIEELNKIDAYTQTKRDPQELLAHAKKLGLVRSFSAKEVLPPPLTSESEPPNLFDGTTRLYISYKSPYAQRTWIARNYKGLQEKIKLVPIDMQNRPAWYKEKVYSTNKDPEKRQFAEELLSYTDTFNKEVFTASRSEGEVDDKVGESLTVTDLAPEWDKIEDALSKFDDGPFFLGQFSLELNKIDAYTQTKRDPQELLAHAKKLGLIA